ncbi:unnamed protein product, partial [Rotaria sp. Silwood2]
GGFTSEINYDNNLLIL